MEAYQAGEAAAFNELYERYSGKIYSYLSSRLFNRTDRDEVFQSAFLKLHKSRHLYTPQFLFAPWLFTICKTTLIDYLRLKKPEVEMNEVHLDNLASASGAEAALSVSDALSTLSEPQRKALALRYQDGLDFPEIADRMKTSSVNVRQIISRAVRKIRGNK
ncbi:MAG: sigma-70 family RNA polymerase sigma factor [Oligoflexia bacterium]|nr:sigma-70 family RNA polymerase sigma factor [Oligoflexia bacterium]